MLTLYKSMVRSKLEYCCPLWNPSSVAEMLKLERIKRIFTSKVEGCRELPYWERLKYLRIQSLQRRRERYIIIHTWKILNDLTNNDIGITFSNGKNCTRSGYTACIVPPVPRGVPAGVATLYEHSFAVKAPQLWNCLPSKAVDKDASSLSAFKSSLGTFLDKVPDMPPTGQSGVNNNSLTLTWQNKISKTDFVVGVRCTQTMGLPQRSLS